MCKGQELVTSQHYQLLHTYMRSPTVGLIAAMAINIRYGCILKSATILIPFRIIIRLKMYLMFH
jgi:hypothetical protein